MKTFLVLSYCIISFSVIYAQNPEWINYTSGQGVGSTAIEGDTVWVGTGGGLVKLNKTTGEKTFLNKGNSGLPSNGVTSIVIDGSGNKWIGTSGGLAKFDGTTWTVYNISNSGLPSNSVTSIAIDGSGNKWIGTIAGLAKFDGTTWTVYNESNSSLPTNGVNSIAIDGSGNKWIGTNGGLAVYKEGGVVSVKEIPGKNFPEAFSLFQNYPNPFNPSTNIMFNLAAKSLVSLKVFDVIGREVAILVAQEMSAGNHSIQWNAATMSSGVYFYRLQSGSNIETKKLILLR